MDTINAIMALRAEINDDKELIASQGELVDRITVKIDELLKLLGQIEK